VDIPWTDRFLGCQCQEKPYDNLLYCALHRGRRAYFDGIREETARNLKGLPVGVVRSLSEFEAESLRSAWEDR